MKQAVKAAAPEAKIISSNSDGGSTKTKASKTAKATKSKTAKAMKGKAAVNMRTKAVVKATLPDAENSSGEDNDEALKASKPTKSTPVEDSDKALKASKPTKSAPVGKGKKAVSLTPVPEAAPVTRKNALNEHIQPPPPSKAPAQKIQPHPIKKTLIDTVASIPPQTDVTAAKIPLVLNCAKRIP